MALSGHIETICCLSAFGAKRTCMDMWHRGAGSRLTHSAVGRVEIPQCSSPSCTRVSRWADRQVFMTRFAVAHFLLVLSLLTVGCSDDSNPQAVTKAQEQAIIESAKGSHRLQAGEKIRVTVSGEASLSGDYQIDPSGDLSLHGRHGEGGRSHSGGARARISEEVPQRIS
jgi:hypothetical protein